MSIQVIWSKIVLEEFLRIAGLTKQQEAIMRLRVAGHTRTQIAFELNISLSTEDRQIRRIKRIYDAVQPYSPILPPRKHSAQETYLDTH